MNDRALSSLRRVRPSLVATALCALFAVASAASAAPGGGHGFGGGGRSAGPSHSGGWTGGSGGAWRGGWNGGWRGPYRGGWGYRGWGPGYFWGGVGLGVGLGSIAYWNRYPTVVYADGWYDYPEVVAPIVVTPPAAVPLVGSTVVRSGQPVPTTALPDPIFYPNRGQNPAAIESDRRECNRWATSQPGAMSDASIFQRATLACMEGRGYTVK